MHTLGSRWDKKFMQVLDTCPKHLCQKSFEEGEITLLQTNLKAKLNNPLCSLDKPILFLKIWSYLTQDS